MYQKTKTNKTMTRKERREYILALDKVVKRWDRNSMLFCGGCCFSAGQIAKLLEKKGIRYQAICWQAGNPNENSLEEIIKENNCCHIAIQVSLDNKKFIIGGDFDSFRATNVRIYRYISSKTIMDCDRLGVKYNTWNFRYDRRLNGRFVKILNKAVSK